MTNPVRWASALALAAGCTVAGTWAVVAAPSAGAATTLVVSAATGSDANPCTATEPCLTINHALSVAAPGSTVDVLAGTYAEDVSVTQRVSLVGAGAATTTIDASGLANGIVVDGASTAGTTVSGFTVTGADNEGILVRATSRVTISDNTVTGNDQGFVFSMASPPGYCTTNNYEYDDCGEGLHLLGTQNSRVLGNTVTDNAGGILVDDTGLGPPVGSNPATPYPAVGPASNNLISHNTVTGNVPDCGITLPAHEFPAAFGGPGGNGGVYNNKVMDNVTEDNGGAGVLMAAPFPGATDARNVVVHNQISGNGMGGVTIHSHSPFQDFSANVVANNTLSSNGFFVGDPDVGLAPGVGADMIVLAQQPMMVTVAHNSFSDAGYGIFLDTGSLIQLPGLPSNSFSTTQSTN